MNAESGNKGAQFLSGNICFKFSVACDRVFSTHFFWHRHWKKVCLLQSSDCVNLMKKRILYSFAEGKSVLHLLRNIIPSPLQQIGCMTCSSIMPRLCLCLCRLCSEGPHGLFHTGDRVHCSLADRNLLGPHIGHSWYIPKNILRMLDTCFFKARFSSIENDEHYWGKKCIIPTFSEKALLQKWFSEHSPLIQVAEQLL